MNRTCPTLHCCKRVSQASILPSFSAAALFTRLHQGRTWKGAIHKGVNETHLASNISGTSLPHPLSAAAVVEHEDSFLILGGLANVFSKKIFNYNPEGQWVEVPTPLSEGKQLPTAINVKATIFPSC